MNPAVLPPKPARPRLFRFFSVYRKFRPSAGQGLALHLERLALASPHLLPDLGFEEDRRAGNPCRAVWRKGAFVVSISRDPGGTTARVDVPPDGRAKPGGGSQSCPGDKASGSGRARQGLWKRP